MKIKRLVLSAAFAISFCTFIMVLLIPVFFMVTNEGLAVIAVIAGLAAWSTLIILQAQNLETA